MKVSPSVNNNVRSTETSQTKKSDTAAKTKQSPESASSAAAAPAPQLAGSYNADISSQAKEMSLARKTAEGTDDVREGKIAELKRRIANKEYNVKADAVADKMISEHLHNPGA